jgi:hypothetical protein
MVPVFGAERTLQVLPLFERHAARLALFSGTVSFAKKTLSIDLFCKKRDRGVQRMTAIQR